jgi:SAM-dependent methyltransferase
MRATLRTRVLTVRLSLLRAHADGVSNGRSQRRRPLWSRQAASHDRVRADGRSLVSRGKTPIRDRRIMPRLRRVAKVISVYVDLARNRRDPDIQKWKSALVGARHGHVVAPSKALASSRGETHRLLHAGVFRPGDRVLDVGAGNGRLAIGLIEAGASSYVGLEIIQGSVNYGRKAFAGYPSVNFELFDVRNAMYNPGGKMEPDSVIFPFADATFECVVASSLFTHLERPAVVERYVSETARVLTADGRAAMSFFLSPPNPVSPPSAVRSVFDADFIYRTLEAHFEIVEEAAGQSPNFHDQRRIYLRKMQGSQSKP